MTRPRGLAPVERRQIPALTGVRAVAAFLVFFHHHPTSALVVGPLLLWKEMHVGVTLFFVLSGLVITWRYDDPVDDRIHSMGRYFLNRFARIYPLYFVLVIPTLLLRHQVSPKMWFLNLTLLKGMSDTYKMAGIGQSWSLTVEECFYASAPFLYILWRRRPAWVLAAGAAVLAVLLPLAMLPAVASVFGPPRFVMLYTYFGRFFEFCVGIWLAKRLAAGPGQVEDLPRRFPLFTVVGAVGIAAVIAALAWLGHGDATSYGLYRPEGIALNNFVLPIFIGAFYWGIVRERSLVRWTLSTATADLLGRSSYAFYLVHHGPILVALTGLLVSAAAILGPAAGGWAKSALDSMPGLFLFVLVLSLALYRLVEHPANRMIRGRAARNEPAPAPSPSSPPTVRTA